MAYIHSLFGKWRYYLPLVFLTALIIPRSSRAEFSPLLYLDGTTLTVCWTATGDDGRNGKASSYDIRYSQQAPQGDTSGWWNDCLRVSSAPAPDWPGIRQCMTIENIVEGAQYYVAMKVIDESGNQSGLSNIASTIYDYYPCADTDGDGWFSVLDMIYMVQCIFDEGPPPATGTGDVNGDNRVNILDIIYMIDFRFFSGPAPACL